MNKLLTITTLCILVTCNKNTSNKAVIKNVLNRKDKTMFYKLSTKRKALFSNDTTTTLYDVYLEQQKKDSHYPYNFKITSSTQHIYYVNDTAYFFTPSKNTYTLKTEHSSLKEFLLPENNLNLNDFQDSINDNITIQPKGSDTLLVTKKYDDDDRGIKNIQEVYTFVPAINQITNIQSSLDFQNTNQFHNYRFYDFDYQKKFNLAQELTEKKKEYNLIEISEEKNTPKTERKDTVNLTVKGKLFGRSKTKSLDTFKNKLLVLEFWYMSCHPCILNIPVVNKLHDRFSNDDNVLVLSINVRDNQKEKHTTLEEFIDYNHINYPVFMAEELPYTIYGYPTTLILNEKREIIHEFSGYHEKMDTTIIDAIEKELKK